MPDAEPKADVTLRLILRDPELDAIAESLADEARVVGEPIGDVAIHEPAALLERLRQIPVKQRAKRLDAGLEQSVDQAVIEREARGVDGATPLRQHARPRDAEAIRVQPELAHERDVVAIAMVVVASDITAVALENGALALAKHVPRAEAAAVFVRPRPRSGRRPSRTPRRTRQGRCSHSRRS